MILPLFTFVIFSVPLWVRTRPSYLPADNLIRLPLAFGITYMTSPAVFFPPPPHPLRRRLSSSVTAELFYLKQKGRIPRLDSENPT